MSKVRYDVRRVEGDRRKDKKGWLRLSEAVWWPPGRTKDTFIMVYCYSILVGTATGDPIPCTWHMAHFPSISERARNKESTTDYKHRNLFEPVKIRHIYPGCSWNLLCLEYSTGIVTSTLRRTANSPAINLITTNFRMTRTQLSKNDSGVLSALFDPESSLSSTVPVDHDSHIFCNASKWDALQEQERLALRSINKEAPQTEELEYAICCFTEIIESEPGYGSAWNNRAQARRMLIRDDELPQDPSLVAELLTDLAQAISLATPAKADITISSADASVLASAHTHRGYLLLLASKSGRGRKMLSNTPGLCSMSIEDLEEAASRELAMGGRYGNETARQLAVKTNPYAKLCGSIVREALTKEIADFYQPQLDLTG